MKYLSLIFVLAFSSLLKAECQFDEEHSSFKPLVECSVYNGLKSKRAHNMVLAMKACVGVDESGKYYFQSDIQKSVWMKDRSVIELDKKLNFVSEEVKNITDKKSKAESVEISVSKKSRLENKEKIELSLNLKEKKIVDLELKQSSRSPMNPISKIIYHVTMACVPSEAP